MHESQLYNPTTMYKIFYSFLLFLPSIPKFHLSFHFPVSSHLLPTEIWKEGQVITAVDNHRTDPQGRMQIF